MQGDRLPGAQVLEWLEAFESLDTIGRRSKQTMDDFPKKIGGPSTPYKIKRAKEKKAKRKHGGHK